MKEFILGTSGIEYGIAKTEQDLKDLYLNNKYQAAPQLIPYLPCAYVKRQNKDFEGTVYIADSYKGYPVRILSEYSFSKLHKIKEVHVPASVICCANCAFNECKGLEKIQFYGDLEYTKGNIIVKCSNLQDVIVPQIKLANGMFSNQINDRYNTTLRMSAPILGNLSSSYAYNQTTSCEELFLTPMDAALYNRYNTEGNQSIPSPRVARNVKKLHIVYSDYLSLMKTNLSSLTSKGNTILNFPNVEEISFSPQCQKIEILPIVYYSQEDLVQYFKLKKIYINNIIQISEDYINFETEDATSYKSAFFSNQIPQEKIKDITVYVSWKREDYINEAKVIEELMYPAKIVYNWKERYETDFIGFTFMGNHSINDLKIYRTSNGSRYTKNLTVGQNDVTGNSYDIDGTQLFNTDVTSPTFTIDFAFDNLTESGLRKLYQTFSLKSQGELYFDEEPYKIYEAKVSAPPQINYVLFDQCRKPNEPEKERIYKGNGSISFICYRPYAHTPLEPRNGVDGKFLKYYMDDVQIENKYARIGQWKNSALLIELNEEYEIGRNRGQMPAPFIISINDSLKKGTQIYVANNVIQLDEDVSSIEWDSYTGLVIGKPAKESNKRAISFLGNSLGAIPVNINIEKLPTNYIEIKFGESTLSKSFTLNYSFWYY